MKPLNIKKESDLRVFVEDCKEAIIAGGKNPFPVLPTDSFINTCIKSEKYALVFDAFNGNVSLWTDGYACLLKPRSKQVFMNYRLKRKSK